MTASLSSGNAPVAAAAKPRKKSKLKWYLIGAVVLFGVLVAVGIAKKRGANTGISVTTEKAVTKTIVQVVTATGKVQSEVEVKITSEVFGEITDLPYREGATVKKGDLIVSIRPDTYQAQVDQQVAAVAVARAGRGQQRGPVLEKASKADLKKYQDLYDRKLVSDFDYLTPTRPPMTRPRPAARPPSRRSRRRRATSSRRRTRCPRPSLYAPMDGTVSSRTSEVGERVQSVVRVHGHRDHARGRPEQDGGSRQR